MGLAALLLALRRKPAKRSPDTKLRDELSAVQFDALWHITVTKSAVETAISQQ